MKQKKTAYNVMFTGQKDFDHLSTIVFLHGNN